MQYFYGKFILLIFCISISYGAWSQNNEIKVKFIGNCGLYLSDGKSHIYTDFPYKSGAFGYMKYNMAEIDSIKENAIFIFTHKHPDHYSKKNLKRYKRKYKSRVYKVGKTMSNEKLLATIDDFKIEVIKTKHRFSFKHYSYLITWHGKRIYFSGDTETCTSIASYKDLDWAFVPVWILIDAKEKKVTIDAKKIGIYHLYPNQKVNNTKPEKYVVFDKQGEVISIPY